ncbi:hypothetical protein Bbelb_259890, partial [Branchiostoma belcheri]
DLVHIHWHPIHHLRGVLSDGIQYNPSNTTSIRGVWREITSVSRQSGTWATPRRWLWEKRGVFNIAGCFDKSLRRRLGAREQVVHRSVSLQNPRAVFGPTAAVTLDVPCLPTPGPAALPQCTAGRRTPLADGCSVLADQAGSTPGLKALVGRSQRTGGNPPHLSPVDNTAIGDSYEEERTWKLLYDGWVYVDCLLECTPAPEGLSSIVPSLQL